MDTLRADDGSSVSSQSLRTSLARSSSVHKNEFVLLPTNDNAAKTRRATRDMTINKLRFHTLGLIGRSEEVALLKQGVERATEKQSRELILISGESGTGKTALATSVGEEKNDRCIFLSSKFDLMLREKEPYAGIVGACQDLCRKLLLLKESNQDRFDTIHQGLQEALGSDLSLLVSIITELDEIFDMPPQLYQMSNQSMQEQMNRTVYAFRRFFQKLCTLFPSAVVITLDDCQWADFASLYLLEVLLTDDSIGGLVIIGCYRSDEVFDAHILSQMVRNLQLGNTDAFCITKICVGNLLVHQVQELLMELLAECNTENVEKLAQVCHRKTLGNAFFLQQFLGHLEEVELLKFNFGLMKWTWNAEDIATQTMATNNVLDLLRFKMAANSLDVNNLLALVACMGSVVPESVLCIVWSIYFHGEHTIESHENMQGKLNPLLLSAIEEGFLEHHPSLSTYQFVHDKMHECCLATVNPLRLPGMKTRIGHIVLNELHKGSFAERFLFVAASLLNEGLPPDETSERVALANLNLQAAQNAADASSFSSASKYVEHGVNLLPPALKWTDGYYDLTLHLYSLGAEVEYALSNVEAMQIYCDEVLKQADRPLIDKFRVYNVVQDSLLNQEKHDESVKLGFEVLRKLGYEFPRRWISIQTSIIAQVGKSLMSLSKRTVNEIETLPILTDPLKLQEMHILDKTTRCCYIANDDRLILAVLRNFDNSLKHGLCEYSPPVWASFGVLLVSLGEFSSAARIADCCRAIVDKIESRRTTAKTMHVLNFLVLPWFHPYQGLQKQLFEGYNTGLLVGDVESACWCIAQYLAIGFLQGKNLLSLDADAKIYIKQQQEFGQIHVFKYIALLHAVIQELSGQSDSDMGRDAKTFYLYDQLNTVLQHQSLEMHQSRLCAIMGYHAEGAQLSIERGDKFAKNALGFSWHMGDAFYRGVTLFAMAHKTRKRKYGSLARKQWSLIKTWAKKGNPNVSHYDCLLNAENEVFAGRYGKGESLFQKGIAMASRAGFIMDAALGSERCADFLLSKMKDQEGASYRMQEAVRYYKEWGAQRKVEQMENNHGESRPGPPDGVYIPTSDDSN
ncbi:Transcriptional regulator [Seminavis robusta]|uniref:Transcriptional regulator n=1 Tax=Seminavis robusta TaxID=568900 RepID=A0A9N8HNT6_9STRA|nr:Transcriptional regulator [Seminavis robusta]|eukprot:Sro1023_g232530.1 Transcriptional regulator (1081) ;mRNA; r:21828-25070